MRGKAEGLKKRFLRALASLIHGRSALEGGLCRLCSVAFFREDLRLGSIAYAILSLLKKPEARVAELGGYKMWVRISEYSGMMLYFFKLQPEPFAARLAWNLLDAGDVAIDLGANVGSYTFLMASKVGPRGKVIAFEPDPSLHRMLCDSIALNRYGGFVRAERAAVSDRSGRTVKFFLSGNMNNSGTSSLVFHGVFLDEERYVMVKTVALADYFREHGIRRCALLKIDVERAELDVLHGMLPLLERHCIDYVILEQTAAGEAQDLLCSFQYRCLFIDESRKALRDAGEIDRGHFGNYLFVSPKRLERFRREFGERAISQPA